MVSAIIAGMGTAPKEIKAWKTIRLGIGPKTTDGFVDAIEGIGGPKVENGVRQRPNEYGVEPAADDLMRKPEFTVSDKETFVDLVRISLRELGLKDGAMYKEIFAKAEERGLRLCPAEVGPQLRLQYLDQPEGEKLVIGMRPLNDGDSLPCVFTVGHSKEWGLILGAAAASKSGIEDDWHADSEWVFIKG